MATITGYGTAYSPDASGVIFNNPGNILLAPDLALTDVTVNRNTSEVLMVTTNEGAAGDFSSLPASAVINGLTVTIKNYAIIGAAPDYAVSFFDGSGANGTKAGTFPSSNGDLVLGGPTDDWLGSLISAANFKAVAWGVTIVVSTAITGDTLVTMDAVKFELAYTPINSGDRLGRSRRMIAGGTSSYCGS